MHACFVRCYVQVKLCCALLCYIPVGKCHLLLKQNNFIALLCVCCVCNFCCISMRSDEFWFILIVLLGFTNTNTKSTSAALTLPGVGRRCSALLDVARPWFAQVFYRFCVSVTACVWGMLFFFKNNCLKKQVFLYKFMKIIVFFLYFLWFFYRNSLIF